MTGSPLLLHVFATFAVGGPQVRFATLAGAFGDRFRHAVIAMDGNTACRERLDPALDIAWPEIAIAKGDTLGNLRRFRATLRALRPAALVTYNWGTIEWAMANLPPLVRHVHVEDGFGPEERARQLPRRAWTRRLVLRRSEVVVPSRTLARIATGTWRLSARRVRYLPNGIDLARFDAPPVRWEGEGPVIGTVATLRPEKRLDRLIAAVRLIPHARLLIVGDGPERAALECRGRRSRCPRALRRARGGAGAAAARPRPVRAVLGHRADAAFGAGGDGGGAGRGGDRRGRRARDAGAGERAVRRWARCRGAGGCDAPPARGCAGAHRGGCGQSGARGAGVRSGGDGAGVGRGVCEQLSGQGGSAD